MSIYEYMYMHIGAHRGQKRVLEPKPGVIGVTMSHSMSHPNV